MVLSDGPIPTPLRTHPFPTRLLSLRSLQGDREHSLLVAAQAHDFSHTLSRPCFHHLTGRPVLGLSCDPMHVVIVSLRGPRHSAHAVSSKRLARSPSHAQHPSIETLIRRSDLLRINLSTFDGHAATEVGVWRRTGRSRVSNVAIRCGSGAWEQKCRNYGWAASHPKVREGT